MKIKWITVILVMAALVVFTTQNFAVVTIKFISWSFNTSLAIVIFSSLLGGFTLGWIGRIISRGRKNR